MEVSGNQFEGFEGIEHPALTTKEEIDFLRAYAQDFGAIKAGAAANYINFPNINVWGDDESEARKRRKERTVEERQELEENAELSAFEYKTSKFVAHQYKKSIDQAIENGILSGGDVKINVIDGQERKVIGY